MSAICGTRATRSRTSSSVDPGTSIATLSGMSAQPLSVDTDAGARRTLSSFVLDRVRIQAWDRILFVQCDDGWIVEEAWRRAQRAYVCGLDTSAALVDYARQMREVPGKLEFKTWDGQRLPEPDRPFDRVVVTVAAGEPRDPARLLDDVRRVLRAGGDVYLLHPVSFAADIRRTLAQTGFVEVRELARYDDQTAVLIHARAGDGAARAGVP